MTFFLAMDKAPLARFTVSIIGSISGVSPTETERPNNKASSQFFLVKPTIMKTSATITSIMRIMRNVKSRTPRSKSVSGSS
ncbi:hypothetical protein HRbin09_00696 [bacterium HR09]|nr:hypothetical protein HRbin09_00696 [bacterium HR09]